MPKVQPQEFAMKPDKAARAADLAGSYETYIRRLKTEAKPKDKVLKLKSYPLPVHVKEAIREAIIDTEVHVSNDFGCGDECANCRTDCANSMAQCELWRRPFRNIEGMYGGGVLSFFSFLRSLLALNAVIFVIIFVFINLPQAINTTTAAEDAMLGQLNTTSAVAYACSATYRTNMTANIASESTVAKVQDFLSGTGWMEWTILFYGYYFPTSQDAAGILYNFPLAYLTVMGLAFLASLLLVLVMAGRSFRESVIEEKGSISEKYSNAVFCGWDFSLHEENNVTLKKRLITNEVLAEISDEEHRERHENMSSGRKCGLYTIRVLVNLIILALLGGGAYLIYFVQTKSAEYTAANISSGSFLRLLMEYLPSITISALSAVLPVVFQLLVKLEDYNSETVVLLTLVRIVFVKLFAVVMLVVTVYILVTCSPKDSCNMGAGACQKIFCWETYVGQQFYKLMVTQFLVFLVVFGLVETPRALIVKKCSCKLSQLIGLPEFDIPKSVLDLIYVQIITWFGVVFCPFLPGMAMLALFVLFYLKLASCYYNYRPSDIPYKASRSRTFFLVVLAAAYLLCVVPIGYMMVAMATSKSCGPFRHQESMYAVIPATISAWPSGVRVLFGWIGSAAFMGLVVMVLVMVIHYFATMSSTRLALNRRLEDQLAIANHDKQVLFRQLSDAGLLQKKGAPRPSSTRPKAAGSPARDNGAVAAAGVTPRQADYQHDGWE